MNFKEFYEILELFIIKMKMPALLEDEDEEEDEGEEE